MPTHVDYHPWVLLGGNQQCREGPRGEHQYLPWITRSSVLMPPPMSPRYSHHLSYLTTSLWVILIKPPPIIPYQLTLGHPHIATTHHTLPPHFGSSLYNHHPSYLTTSLWVIPILPPPTIPYHLTLGHPHIATTHHTLPPHLGSSLYSLTHVLFMIDL